MRFKIGKYIKVVKVIGVYKEEEKLLKGCIGIIVDNNYSHKYPYLLKFTYNIERKIGGKDYLHMFCRDEIEQCTKKEAFLEWL